MIHYPLIIYQNRIPPSTEFWLSVSINYHYPLIIHYQFPQVHLPGLHPRAPPGAKRRRVRRRPRRGRAGPRGSGSAALAALPQAADGQMGCGWLGGWVWVKSLWKLIGNWWLMIVINDKWWLMMMVNLWLIYVFTIWLVVWNIFYFSIYLE